MRGLRSYNRLCRKPPHIVDHAVRREVEAGFCTLGWADSVVIGEIEGGSGAGGVVACGLCLEGKEEIQRSLVDGRSLNP
jgi:hypothetical protein